MNRPSLQLERLEDRVLLAANLQLLGGGQLVLTGDGGVDEITIEAGTDPGSIDVTADFGAGVETRTVLDIKNITVRTGGGDDVITVEDVQLGGNLTIDAGTGDDIVVIGGGEAVGHILGGSLTVKTGLGDDSIAIEGVHVKGNVNLNDVGGATLVTLTELDVGRQLNIQTAAGTDQVNLSDSVAQNVKIKTGLGDATINVDSLAATNLNVEARGGAAGVSLDGLVLGGSLAVRTGAGIDTVEVGSALIARNATIATLEGGDTVMFAGAESALRIGGNLSIATHAGDDTVALENLRVIGRTNIDLGVGENELHVGAEGDVQLFASGLTIKGGAGTDLVELDELQVVGQTRVDLGHGDNILRIGAGLGTQSFLGNVVVSSGAGTDLVSIDNSYFAANVNLRLGAGDDTVEVNQNGGVSTGIVGKVDVRLDAGADSVLAQNLTVNQKLSVDGGAGIDVVTDTLLPSITLNALATFKAVESTNVIL